MQFVVHSIICRLSFLQSEITIQHYCESWKTYVDLEEGEEVADKEQLNVVVHDQLPPVEPQASPDCQPTETRYETEVS